MATDELRINLVGLYTPSLWIDVPKVVILEKIPCALNCSNQVWSEVFNRWWLNFIDELIIGCVDKGARNHIIHEA